jgi:hypothetical protein
VPLHRCIVFAILAVQYTVSVVALTCTFSCSVPLIAKEANVAEFHSDCAVRSCALRARVISSIAVACYILHMQCSHQLSVHARMHFCNCACESMNTVVAAKVTQAAASVAPRRERATSVKVHIALHCTLLMCTALVTIQVHSTFAALPLCSHSAEMRTARFAPCSSY